jgi:hypothetical protein
MPIIRNPLLDGLASTEEQGNNPFRIDLINPLTIPGAPSVGSVSSGGFSSGAPSEPTIVGSGSPSGGTGFSRTSSGTTRLGGIQTMNSQ